MKKKAITVAFLFSCILFNSAAGAIISSDLDRQNDGLVTLDTLSNIRWLDLTVTSGMSVQDVLSGAGGRNFISEGWRYATINDIQTFLEHSGIGSPSGVGFDTAHYVSAKTPELQSLNNVINLLGITYGSGYMNSANGWASPFLDAPWRAVSQPSNVHLNCCQDFFGDVSRAGSVVMNSDWQVNNGYFVTSHVIGVGSFLIQDLGKPSTVPEPSIMALFFGGLIPLAILRKLRKSKR